MPRRDAGDAGAPDPRGLELLAPDLVIKFGGAALRGPSRVRISARRVAALVRAGRVPVVVASAPGRTTDRLLARADATRTVDAFTLAGEDSAADREQDRLLATGEQRSASLLALALLRLGVSARSFSGPEAGLGVLPDGQVVVDPAPLRLALHRGWVPVVAGFQAIDVHGELRTLGRGGSDLTAVALAEALGAAECRLAKDVAGVFAEDPRSAGGDAANRGAPAANASHPGTAAPAAPAGAVAAGAANHVAPGPHPFPTLSPGALVELARAGARVVQVEAAERARAAGIRLRVHDFRAPALRPGGTVVDIERTRRRRAS